MNPLGNGFGAVVAQIVRCGSIVIRFLIKVHSHRYLSDLLMVGEPQAIKQGSPESSGIIHYLITNSPTAISLAVFL